MISQTENLTYSLVSNSNSALVTPTFSTTGSGSSAAKDGNYLTLNYTAGMTGSAQITVQATDQFGATVQQTFTVNVGAAVPVVTSAAIALDAGGDTLTVTPTQTSATSDTYQWFQGGTAIGGATSSSLSLTSANNTGQPITVAVTPIDGSTPGLTFTSKPVTLSGSGVPYSIAAPTITSVSIAADNPLSASTLTATPTSTDDGTGNVTYSYQWFQNGSKVGTNSATLTLSGLTVNQGDQFTVQVTPTDTNGGAGAAFTTTNPVTVSSVASSTIALTVPTVNPVTITSSGSTLTATPTGTAPAGSTLGFTYQWMQNGNNIPGATSSTLDLTTPGLAVNANDYFNVQVTPTGTVTSSGVASTTAGTSVTSNTLFVTNTNPYTLD